MTTFAPDPNLIRPIPLDLIDPPNFNSRLGFDAAETNGAADPELPGLAKSMAAKGLEQPIGVVPEGERYRMVFGSRRYRAARLLKWTEIPAIVKPPMSEVDSILANGVENLQRKNLSTFEEARLCAELRAPAGDKEKGLQLKECAERLGFSVPKVSNYARAYSFLPDHILSAWRTGEKAADMVFLIELAGIKGDTEKERVDKIMAAWADRLALQEQADAILSVNAGDETDDEDESDDAASNGAARAKPKDFKVSRDFYKFIVQALKEKRSVAGANLAMQVLDLAVGKIQGVRGLTSRDAFDKQQELKKSNKA